MRKYIKNNLLHIVDIIEKANALVLSFSEANHTEKMLDILIQEQEAAIQVGTELENNHQSEIVVLLEDYCECLYRISQESERKFRKVQIQELSGKIAVVKGKIAELKEEYDIVFMPYKASMWDSLESIWLAANEDPDCHCYVVPIPYNDMEKDGTRGELHYEGDLFPSYVPITSYKEYDVAAKHPEVIYIHNPYDQYNHVTNIAEKFFSYNLKNCTEKLVYVPYFFTSGKFPEDHSLLSAYLYADKIIVQSEECIDTIDEKIPREKIVALGSPKVDRILRLTKEKERIIEEEIPLEWKEKIQGKKVVLYNVSLNAMLSDTERVMNKMRYVFSVFERRNDIVLLWRPHPLMEATLKAMRNSEYEEYLKLKDYFCNSSYGIMDDTSDPTMASVIADVYVGEKNTSMINYFAVQGKLCYFLDWDKLEETYTKEERSAFPIGEVVEQDNFLYYLPRKLGLEHVLCRVNIDTGKTEQLCKMPGKPSYTEQPSWGDAYIDFFLFEDKIILPPYHTDDIYIYDRKEKSALRYVLPEVYGCKEALFGRSVYYSQKLFLLPVNYPGILECDLEQMRFTIHNDWVSEFNYRASRVFSVAGSYYNNDNYVYMVALEEAKMLIFNLDDKTYRTISLGAFSHGFYSMVYDGEDFWFSGFKKDVIVRWNEKIGKKEVYTYETEKEEHKNVGSVSLVNTKDRILALHTVEHLIFDINKATGKIKKRFVKKKESSSSGKLLYAKKSGYTLVRQLKDEWIKCFDFDEFKVVLWNYQTDEYKEYPCRMSEKMLYDIESKEIEREKIIKNEFYQIFESQLDIDVFLDYFMKCNKIFDESSSCYEKRFRYYGNSGKTIHSYIKNDYICPKL